MEVEALFGINLVHQKQEQFNENLEEKGQVNKAKEQFEYWANAEGSSGGAMGQVCTS